MRWKALDEIYKIYMLLHFSDLSILANSRFNIRNAKKFENFPDFVVIFAAFHEICSDFLEKRCNYSKLLDFDLILA